LALVGEQLDGLQHGGRDGFGCSAWHRSREECFVRAYIAANKNPMTKKTRVKLSKHRKAGPSDYLVFENPDKRDAGDVTASELSWPWRACICGPPGAGKRVLLLNMTLLMKERPARTVVIHLDKTTREYDKIADELYTLDDGFDFEALGNGDQRTLLILDELPWANLTKV
jgi:hypothetical protein